MRPKRGLKRTAAGAIPEDWGISTVGREFEIQLGKMLDANKNTGTPKYYLGNRAVQWDRIVTDDLPTVPLSPSDLKRFRLRHGDLLVCEGGEVGRAAIWESPLSECYYQKALHRLRPSRGFSPQLMLVFLRYWAERGVLADYVTQTSIAHLPKDKLANIPLPMPQPEEQNALSALFADVNSLLNALDRLITKKSDLKQAAMQQLLTGKRRLPGYRGEWSQRSIGKLMSESGGSIQTGPFGTLLKASEYTAEGHFVISVGEIGPGVIRIGPNTPRVPRSVVERLPEYVLRDGDIVFGRKGAVDRSALVRGNGMFLGSDAIRLRVPASCHPQFIGCQLQTHSSRTWLSQHAIGTTMASLNHEILERVSFLVPPTLEEQSAIASVLSDMDAEIAALERRRDKTRLLKQGMMQELLTGRIRLV